MLDAVGEVERSSGSTSPAAADLISFIERSAAPPVPVMVRTIATTTATTATISVAPSSLSTHGLRSTRSRATNLGRWAAMGTAAPVSSTAALARAALWHGYVRRDGLRPDRTSSQTSDSIPRTVMLPYSSFLARDLTPFPAPLSGGCSASHG